jgi:hypothetical protein
MIKPGFITKGFDPMINRKEKGRSFVQEVKIQKDRVGVFNE